MNLTQYKIQSFAKVALVASLGLCCFGAIPSIAATTERIPVIIDTDIGDDIDDAFALALAVTSPKLSVLGVTTAWGDTQKRVWLTRRLLAALGRPDIPVAQGPKTDTKIEFTQSAWAEGHADKSNAPDMVSFLANMVAKYPGQITLIALAPLTNIEALAKADPKILAGFKSVVMMGGSIHFGYNKYGAIRNTLPSAEYNVASSPQGLRNLLDSGVPVTMFPLDASQIKFDEVRRDRVLGFGSAATDALAALYHQWRLRNTWGQITPTLFDSAPVAWLQDPSLCQPKASHVEVDDKGFTTLTPGQPNASVCLSIDDDRVVKATVDQLAP
jgi:inosine-uridine nucleoside N-ribohydrolase